jgi:predicted DNA-binding transcriptional regulator AlpA
VVRDEDGRDSGELLTAEDVHRILALRDVRAVYNLVEHRNPDIRLPAIRIGRRLRWTRKGIDAYIAAHAENGDA